MSAMMLRRRTERKAKVAASSLFKRVASGQDWNPSSPSTCIPVKRTPPKSKTVVGSSSKPGKSVTSSSKVAAVSAKKGSSGTRQKSAILQKKQSKRVHEKSDLVSKKGAAKLPQKTGNSHRKGIEVSPKQVKSVKTIVTKAQVKPSALPKKADAKVLPRLGTSPKMESVALSVKAVVSPKKVDSLVPQKLCITPKKEDGKLPQKLSASPKKLELEPLQKTDVRITAEVEKTDDTKHGDKPDNCAKKKVTNRSEKERSGEPKKDSDAVISVTPPRPKVSPVKDTSESGIGSGSLCHAQKRKLEPEVESLMTSDSDKYVKLMKLEEDTVSIDDQSGDRVESQVSGQTADGYAGKEDLSPALDTKVTHEQIDRNAIAYPSDRCPSINFLAMIGLVPKSDIKKLEGSPNKLHREAGGKLRRILKPRLMPGMVYRKVTITKGLSISGIVIDHQLKPGLKSVTSVPGALRSAVQSKPKVSTFSAVTKFTLLRNNVPPLLASPKLSKAASPPKAEIEAVKLESKLDDTSAGVVVVVEENATKEVATMPDDNGAKETKEAEVLVDVTVVQSPVKPKCLPRKKPEPVKPCTVLNLTSDLEPIARRSARQQNNKRRAWGHLLRANPDEFEESHKWETGAKDPLRNPPKTNSLEDDAQTLMDKTINDESTVVDVVGGALAVPEKTDDEDRAGKPVQEVLTACETEGSREPASSHAESFFASLVLEMPAEVSFCERKSSPVKKPAQLTGKKQKKVLKDSVGKSPRTSKTTSLADKSKAAEKTEEENKVSKSKTESKVKNLDGVAPSNYSFLSYRCKETDCQTPHMCSVCWVNDHMYCRNMKRTTSDLPSFGGCIHYIPCGHYWPPTASSSLKRSSSDHNPFHNRVGFLSGEGLSTVERSWSDDDLMCREEMVDSDSESSHPVPPKGTEILGIQLKSRAEQIIRSLGIDRMPESLDRGGGARVESSQDLDKEEEEEDDCDVVVEEYGAELCVDNAEELEIEIQKDSLDDQTPTSKLPSVEEHDCHLTVGDPRKYVSEVYVENCDSPADTAICGVPKELASGLLSPNLCVFRVQVQKLDADRVRVTYPKIREGHGPGDDCGNCFVQKEVKFPTGADEKSLNEFLAQEAVRLVNEAPLEGQRKAAGGVKRPLKSGSEGQKQERGTKLSAAAANCTTNEMGKTRKKLKGVEHASGCLDPALLARKEGLGQRPRKRTRKVLCQSDVVLPTAAARPGITKSELCGRDVLAAKGTALSTEMGCLLTAGMEFSPAVTSVQDFSQLGKVLQIPREEVGPSVHDLAKMNVTWSCSSTRAPSGGLAALDSSSTGRSSDPIAPTLVTNCITSTVVHPVCCSAPGEIPDILRSRWRTLDSNDHEDRSVSSDRDLAINVNLDQGSSVAANEDQDVGSNQMVDFHPESSVSYLLSDVGPTMDGPTVLFHPQGSIASRPIPVYHHKELEQSCIAQLLQQQNSASSAHPIAKTLSLSRGTSVSTASVSAKSSLAPSSAPRAILPCKPSSCRPQTYNSVDSISAAHSLFTGVVPGAITRTAGLVMPLGYSVPFVSVNSRLPPQLTHLPISATVGNTRQSKPNCVEFSNVALANLAFSSPALTGFPLASTLPVKVAMGGTTSANLASMNLVLKNVSCPNLATTDVTFNNSSSLIEALASMTSVNMTPTSLASVSVVPVNMAPVSLASVSLASVSMASSGNMTVGNMTSGNVSCGSTIICVRPAVAGPPTMKITRLDQILAGNHGPPLLITQTRSGLPNAIVSTRPAPTEYLKVQSCATAVHVQSPSVNVTKHSLSSPLTLSVPPTNDIIQMAWNQCNDACVGPTSCQVGSGENAVCVVTTASDVSPTFFSVGDGSNVIV